MQFLLSAGEASGDTYGAQLIEALSQLAVAGSNPQPSFFGMGGDKMQTAGCELLVHANEVAVVGLAEVVRHLPDIRSRFKHLIREAARRKPDAAVLIDFPDFNLRLARELYRLGIPVFYFVSPQVWAWRTGRVKQIQKYVRKMIVIFPFEQDFYRSHGVEVTYVGHPLAYLPQPQITRDEFAALHGLDPKKHWIALLPGSRRKEVRLNLPEMLKVVELLQQQGEYDFVLPVASTLKAEWLKEEMQGLKPQFNDDLNAPLKGRSSTFDNDSSGHSLRSPTPEGRGRSSAVDSSGSAGRSIASNSTRSVKNSRATIHLTDNARATLMHARAAVVASGTATVETALSGTPFVVVYRLAPLTWILGRRLVKLDTFAMPNLIAGKTIVPELIQTAFTSRTVVRELSAIIPDGPAREQMLAALKMVQQKLRDSQTSGPPIVQASREIMKSLEKAAESRG